VAFASSLPGPADTNKVGTSSEVPTCIRSGVNLPLPLLNSRGIVDRKGDFRGHFLGESLGYLILRYVPLPSTPDRPSAPPLEATGRLKDTPRTSSLGLPQFPEWAPATSTNTSSGRRRAQPPNCGAVYAIYRQDQEEKNWKNQVSYKLRHALLLWIVLVHRTGSRSTPGNRSLRESWLLETALATRDRATTGCFGGFDRTFGPT
jgi:hypothetical protein